jgi:penicillin-binding protein 1A
VLRQIGVQDAIRHIEKLGIPGDQLPRNLSLALGSGEVTPVELAGAYTAFANGGYGVTPYFIDRVVENGEGVIYRAYPDRAISASEMAPARPSEVGPQRPDARPAERVIDERTAWQMRSMLQDVVREGTGRSALQLGRADLAGKTGTTNDQQDAWFSGFGGDLVTTAWVGFDELQTLGRYETGGRAALPVWIHFMGAALKGRPETEWSRPAGLVTVRIDPETGQRTDSDDEQAIFETFREENLPKRDTEVDEEDVSDGRSGGDGTPIF